MSECDQASQTTGCSCCCWSKAFFWSVKQGEPCLAWLCQTHIHCIHLGLDLFHRIPIWLGRSLSVDTNYIESACISLQATSRTLMYYKMDPKCSHANISDVLFVITLTNCHNSLADVGWVKTLFGVLLFNFFHIIFLSVMLISLFWVFNPPSSSSFSYFIY